ncbi:catecholate siderophore receptor [Haloferula luteola]|uniref:Catecholate siderophore receptor n=1 Tax=Haloferula luteola TaxID=595692 RepID=A0A840VG73_9BACT|nr:TonB-dependent siderophore receptor [Haloferula luteola]MBB5352830.1 catecholate siderophore receptor [Haloferula luteola]
MNATSPSSESLRQPRFQRESLAFTGTLVSLGTLAAPALAAEAPSAPATDEKPKELDQLVVEAENTTLYKPERLASPKFQKPVEDIPQTLSVIPKEVIREQNATSLRDVLRNTPGISIQAGEGGTPPGDNLSIRGFSAQSDLFVDGVRDFGGYTRDPFNLEQVEVAKGPASTNSGRGSTGGSVNLVSKKPFAEKAYDLMLGVGTDNYFRGTADLNQPIDGLNGAAVRLNLMYHNADTPGRDQVTEERWGVAPSITFGLGTPTRFTASYFYLSSDGIPDYGIPWVASPNVAIPWATDRPAPVDYDNFYGLVSRDYLKNETHLFSAELEHDFSDQLRLRNLTRYGVTSTDLSVTAPRFVDVLPGTPGNQYGTVIRRSDWKSRDQEDTVFANQTDLNFDFETGWARHQAVAGFEVALERSKNYSRTDLGTGTPNTDLFYPNPFDPYFPIIVRDGTFTSAQSTTYAVYLTDSVELGDCWQIDAGLRYDHLESEFTSATVPTLTKTSTGLSYRGALTWKPTQNGNVYFGYGTSFDPSSSSPSSGVRNNAAGITSYTTDPEESETLELGTKWTFFDDRLMATAAFFRTDKTNARTTDPVTGNTVLTGDQRVQGLELGVSGEVTDWWRLTGGYVFLDSEVRSSGNLAEIGNELSNTPEQSFSLWNVFTFAEKFQAGIGTYYVDSRYSNNTNTRSAPSYWLFDAMFGWQATENVSVQLNVNNLFDKDYIDRVGGGHAIPGSGRTAMLSTRFSF